MKVTRPLHDLTKKENPFHWEEPQQAVFDTLKLHFTTAPILVFPDIDCVFCLKSNASNYATGAVLSIEKEGVWHPIAFSSHSMMPQEWNYPIADKEMLSVIQALEQWRHYLEGARHLFEIWNDHVNLQWFMQRQDLNQRQVCWVQYLSRFNAVWCYKPRPSMGKSDALSRREDHAEGIEDDNKGVVVIIPDKITMSILIMDEGGSLKQKKFNATCLLLEADVQRLCKRNAICKEHDGMLTDNLGRLYMPENNLLRMEVIQKHHNSPVAGHPGYKKTLDLLQRNYYWPEMATTVKEYIARCDTCQRFKGSNAAPAGLLHPLETPSLPWEHISADFITDLPLSHSFDAILTVVDQFSKEVELIPCTKTCLALDTAKLFMHNVWKHHGLPCSITLDQGPQFAAQVMQEINKALGITTKLSTSFHPQMDGQTEIVNKEVQKFLWIYCFEKQDQWANWLAIAQFSINSKKHMLTKVAPFKATRSYIPRMGIEPVPVNKAPAAKDFTSKMEGMLESVRKNLEKAKEQIKLNANKSHLAVPDYTIGQQVWLATENLQLTCAS